MTCLVASSVMMTSPITMMTGAMSWISPSVIRALAWTLLNFLWQGAALAAITAAVLAISRRSSVRYAVGVGALALMFVAPLVTLFFYSGHSGAADTVKSSPLAVAARPTAKGRAAAVGSIQVSGTASSPDALPWLVEAWLLGVAIFGLRSVGGFFLLERKRRLQSSVVSERVLEICYMLQGRLGLERAIQYCECKWLQAPAVIGWFRPIVFLPVSALTGLSEEQLQSVIAHELAHIYRFDAFVNVFQVFVETLLFYHPAVWWLNKRIRAEREHCCDDVAVSLCGNAVEYARALTLMEEWRSAPVLAMAANRGPPSECVFRVLGLKTLSAGVRGIGLIGSVLGFTVALMAGNALVGITRPRLVHAGLNAQFLPPVAAAAPAQQSAPRITPAPAAKPSAAQSPSSSQQSSAESSTGSSYIDRMKSVGLSDLSFDTLVALKVQDVTPEYVRGLQEQGLHPDVHALIAMRVQGVTPEYIRDLHAAGLTPDQNEIIALKVQGGDAEYYRELIAAGIQPNIDKLIGLKVQGVTPEYVRELHAAGLTPTVDQVIALKVQDVSPAYLKAMHDQGIEPRTEDAIAMRVQDVTPEYIKALQTAGFKFGINDIISAKVQDVTPEFIDQALKHGFKDLTLHKLIELRRLGILDSKAS